LTIHAGQNNGTLEAGQSVLHTLLGNEKYRQTIVTVANVVTFPGGRNQDYLVMVIRMALDSVGITLAEDAEEQYNNDAYELGRMVLHRLVCPEGYIQLMDHADMHCQEGCSCAGGA